MELFGITDELRTEFKIEEFKGDIFLTISENDFGNVWYNSIHLSDENIDKMVEVLRKRKFDKLIDSVNKSLKDKNND